MHYNRAVNLMKISWNCHRQQKNAVRRRPTTLTRQASPSRRALRAHASEAVDAVRDVALAGGGGGVDAAGASHNNEESRTYTVVQPYHTPNHGAACAAAAAASAPPAPPGKSSCGFRLRFVLTLASILSD